MTSKRNSRVFVDEAKHRLVAQQQASSTHRSRRDSHGSVDEDMSPSPTEAEDGPRVGSMPREAAIFSRTRSTSSGAWDKAAASTLRMGEKTIVTSAQTSLVTWPAEFPSAPLDGRPANFGVILPGVYRCGYPKPEDYSFLQSLKLKTVVTLVKKDDIDRDLETFTSSNGIRQVVFNMKGTKKETIPAPTMAAILRLLLDRQHYPLLVHCNHGKHRTGCVAAVIRKLSGWNLDSVLDEYKSYATPKIRECDVDYISAFQSSSLELARIDPPRFSPVQTRTFYRTLLFTTLVLIVWLVSGSKLRARVGA